MKTTKIHPEMQQSMDLQIDCDRDWFTRHPFAKKYFRKPYENEIAQSLQLYGKSPKKMMVAKIRGDLRIKKFVL